MSATWGSVWVFLTLILRKGANSIVTFLLAGILGVADFGIYSFVISAIALLSTFSLLGMDNLTAREIAKNLAKDKFGHVRGYALYSLTSVLVASGLIVAVGTASSRFWSAGLSASQAQALLVGFFFVPVISLSGLARAALRGLHHFVLSQIPESAVKPGCMILLIAALSVGGFSLTPHQSVILFGIASLASLLYASYVLAKKWPKTGPSAPRSYDWSLWAKSTLTFLAINLFLSANTEAVVVLLGIMETPEVTGAFKLASSLAGLITFVLAAVNAPLGPLVAKHVARGETAELQRIITKLARVGFLMALPMAIVCWFLGATLLQLFGEGFVIGFPALAILSTAHLTYIAVGSTLMILMMSGYEAIATKAVAIGAALNITGNVVLIPVLGLEGAAVSVAIGLITSALIMRYYVRRNLAIESSILGPGRTTPS